MHKIAIFLLLLMACTLSAFGRSDAEQQKIQYLIHSVETLQHAAFIRNGVEYDAQRAADHLRLKLRYAGNRVNTAQDFIACCATASSMTGEKYLIRFGDGHIVAVAQFLHDQLDKAAARNAPNRASPQPSSRPAQQSNEINEDGGVHRQREKLQRSETMNHLPDLERDQGRGGDDGEIFSPTFSEP